MCKPPSHTIIIIIYSGEYFDETVQMLGKPFWIILEYSIYADTSLRQTTRSTVKYFSKQS